MAQKEFTLNSTYDEVAGTSRKVRVFCEESKIEKKECDQIELCVTEALNNVIKHSYKGKFKEQIIVHINILNKRLEIDVIDEGEARKSFEKPKLDFDPENIQSLPEGGMGLFIIEEIMNETHYRIEDGKNIFSMRKYVQ
ncbi:ATP-binding protein [Bacteroidota bacterium]